MQNKRIRNKPWEEKIEPIARRNINFDSLKNDADDVGVYFDKKLICLLSTNYDEGEYTKIFEKCPLIPYPILMNEDEADPLVDEKTGEFLRDLNDIGIQQQNEKINKLRIIEILRLMSNLDIPEDNESAISLLDEMGMGIRSEIQKKIQDTIILKNKLKDRRNLLAREMLTFSKNEKAWLEIERYKQKIKISKGSIDGRSTTWGVTHEYMILALAEKYSFFTKDFTLRCLKGDLNKEESALIELMSAKQSLDIERELEIQEEMKGSQGK